MFDFGGTWDALALDGFADDGGGLVARLRQSLAQLLHAVAIHHDGVPAAQRGHGRVLQSVQELP